MSKPQSPDSGAIDGQSINGGAVQQQPADDDLKLVIFSWIETRVGLEWTVENLDTANLLVDDLYGLIASRINAVQAADDIDPPHPYKARETSQVSSVSASQYKPEIVDTDEQQPAGDVEPNPTSSRKRVYLDGELVKDETTCFCGLRHIPPMTHELHEILTAEFKEALKCNDCVYGNYSPHKDFSQKLFEYQEHLIASRLSDMLTGLLEQRILFANGSTSGVRVSVIEAELAKAKEGL